MINITRTGIIGSVGENDLLPPIFDPELRRVSGDVARKLRVQRARWGYNIKREIGLKALVITTIRGTYKWVHCNLNVEGGRGEWGCVKIT